MSESIIDRDTAIAAIRRLQVNLDLASDRLSQVDPDNEDLADIVVHAKQQIGQVIAWLDQSPSQSLPVLVLNVLKEINSDLGSVDVLSY